MDQIIILGSSRSFGNTRKAVTQVIKPRVIPLVDLNTFDIKPYDYEYRNQSDDFRPLIDQVIKFDTLILATPVYWYSMGTPMKIFIDRLTDLLDIRKEVGRKLRGKKLFVIASFGTSLPKGFEDTFEQTCDYLGVSYLGTSFIYSGPEQGLLENNDHEIRKAQSTLQLSSTVI